MSWRKFVCRSEVQAIPFIGLANVLAFCEGSIHYKVLWMDSFVQTFINFVIP